MYVGLARLEYHIPAARSLKAKRKVVRTLVERTRAKFKVAVSEVDFHDKWQRTAIGVAVVGKDPAHLDRMLDQIASFADGLYVAEPLRKDREVIPFGGDDDDSYPDYDAPFGSDDPGDEGGAW